MRSNLYTGIFLAGLFLGPAGVHAQAKACLLEGTFTFGGQSTVMSDCLENKGVPDGLFKQMCEGMSEFTVVEQTFKAKITYLPACPAKAQGVCEGVFEMPLNAHYYKRDTKTLDDTKKSCLAQNSKWR